MLLNDGMKQVANDNEPTWQTLAAATARALEKQLPNDQAETEEDYRQGEAGERENGGAKFSIRLQDIKARVVIERHLAV